MGDCQDISRQEYELAYPSRHSDAAPPRTLTFQGDDVNNHGGERSPVPTMGRGCPESSEPKVGHSMGSEHGQAASPTLDVSVAP
eukprot:gene17748-5570_t